MTRIIISGLNRDLPRDAFRAFGLGLTNSGMVPGYAGGVSVYPKHTELSSLSRATGATPPVANLEAV